MSTDVLQRVEDFITAGSLNTGYAFRYFRWTDEDIQQNTPFIMLRQPGSEGPSNSLLQQIDVQVMVCTIPASVVAGDTRARDIHKRFRGASTQTGVVRFEPLGGVQGPGYLENGRPFWIINVRCFVEDH